MSRKIVASVAPEWRLALFALASAVMAGLLGATSALAADSDGASSKTAEAAPGLVAQCMTCHGPAGLSQNPEWPTIAGQNALYLRKTLLAYRSGERQNDMMRLLTQQLSDHDITALAHYFSQLRPREGLGK